MNQPIGKLDHIVFRVGEMAEACRIWSEVLGFEQLKLGDKWSEFTTGTLTVALMLADDGALVSKNCPELVLEVVDIRTTIERLDAGGLALIDAEREICSQEGHSYRYVRFEIPGGTLGLYQRIPAY